MFGSAGQTEIEDPLREVDHIVEQFADAGISGVISTDDYPGSALACIVAQQLGLPSPDAAVNLICQHKYLSREAQRRLIPEAVPAFALVDRREASTMLKDVGFPAFVKPVKSFFSIGAQQVSSPRDVVQAYARWSELGSFFAPFDKLLNQHAGYQIGDAYLIGEGCPATFGTDPFAP
jgi:biotin carboxylase